MPDASTASIETPVTAPKRVTRSLVNQDHAAEITLAGEILSTAELPAYAGRLSEEGIDAEFLARLRARITEAGNLVAEAGGKTSAKGTTTRTEADHKATLLELIDAMQARAKRKYGAGDPQRANYFINEPIHNSRMLLETSARAILVHLEADALPGVKPEDKAALQAALDAYVAVQTTQSAYQSGASWARAECEVKVAEVARLRREIQYAVEAIWSSKKQANAAIRVEFKLHPDRVLS